MSSLTAEVLRCHLSNSICPLTAVYVISQWGVMPFFLCLSESKCLSVRLTAFVLWHFLVLRITTKHTEIFTNDLYLYLPFFNDVCAESCLFTSYLLTQLVTQWLSLILVSTTDIYDICTMDLSGTWLTFCSLSFPVILLIFCFPCQLIYSLCATSSRTFW